MPLSVPEGWGDDRNDLLVRLAAATHRLRIARRELDDAHETVVSVLAELRVRLAEPEG